MLALFKVLMGLDWGKLGFIYEGMEYRGGIDHFLLTGLVVFE